MKNVRYIRSICICVLYTHTHMFFMFVFSYKMQALLGQNYFYSSLYSQHPEVCLLQSKHSVFVECISKKTFFYMFLPSYKELQLCRSLVKTASLVNTQLRWLCSSTFQFREVPSRWVKRNKIKNFKNSVEWICVLSCDRKTHNGQIIWFV